MEEDVEGLGRIALREEDLTGVACEVRAELAEGPKLCRVELFRGREKGCGEQAAERGREKERR